MAWKGPETLMTTQKGELDFDRIHYLLNPEQFAKTRVTIVGLGSGGAPVCDHLTMNGIRNWDLYDPDVLDGVNLVKHPRLRKELNRSKVEIQKEWILDRNPSAQVKIFCEDVMSSTGFLTSLQESDIVISCPDNKGVREYINDKCVENGVPFVTASVFRTGIGGEIFGYIPKQTGCYQCLQLFALEKDINLSDDDLGLTDQEKDRIYGLDDHDFKASGLSIDIHMIAMIQTRMTLSILLRNSHTSMPRLKSNWIIFGNRPAKNIFHTHFEVNQMMLKPQKNCICHIVGNSERKKDEQNTR